MDLVGLLPPNQKVYLVRYQPGCLQLVPWGNEPYDCFVLNLSPLLATREIADLATDIARGTNDWVQVLGPNAEEIHDAIDQAAVKTGRQKAIGDGSPMTSWHEDISTLEAMVDFVLRGSFGACDYLVAIFIGSSQDYSEADRLAKSRIATRWQGFH